MTRAAFESWISAPPYERSVERQGENGSWPGQYRSYETQAAWEAWQESARQAREAAAELCDALATRAGTADECADAIRARKG